MNATHTPGPWTVRKRTIYAGYAKTVGYLDGISDADARLIAEAPRMLGAVKDYHALILSIQAGADMTAWREELARCLTDVQAILRDVGVK